jgi:trehalose synthase
MARRVEANHHASLDEYASLAHLGGRVRELRDEAAKLVPRIGARRVWMLNSTARGGGVAELLPPLVALLREVGVDAGWLVMEPREPSFFPFTKRLHNLVHGQGEAEIGVGERALYDRVSRETADRVAEHLEPGDVLVVHDPQPMGAGALLRERMDLAAIWRCHIGLDRETPETRAAWDFLCGFAEPYDHAVFTAPEYIPACLAGRSTVIHPAIDPLSAKNRDLSVHELVGILAAGSLLVPSGPVLEPSFPAPAERLQKDGGWVPATQPEDIGLLFRPIVTQVSRWDRLKGFLPLMRGFEGMMRGLESMDPAERRPLEAARLVLAGPDPASVQDDPEAQEVLEEIRAAYLALPPHLQEAVAIVSLPMDSAEHNALLVNALQRCSDVVAQNSLQEGFGLTATEAMWKRSAVMGSCAAGLRQQIRPELDGLLVSDPEDAEEIARTLTTLLCDRHQREALGARAQQRVHHDFLVFTQVRRWLELIAETVEARWG